MSPPFPRPLPPTGRSWRVSRAGAARLVGEDVVDLVAAAALQPAHVGPVAVAILELDLGLGLAHRLVARILLLGEAEVDQRAMPCVAKRHAAVLFRA